MSGSKRDVNGEWKRVHNDELQNLHYSPNIIVVLINVEYKMAGHVARLQQVNKQERDL